MSIDEASKSSSGGGHPHAPRGRSLGISINHFERKVQPELKVVLSGQLVLIPSPSSTEWVPSDARRLVELPARGGAA